MVSQLHGTAAWDQLGCRPWLPRPRSQETLGARAHAQMSRFTAGAGQWPLLPPGLGGKWEPNLVAGRPLATEMQMLVAARQPPGTSQAWSRALISLARSA